MKKIIPVLLVLSFFASTRALAQPGPPPGTPGPPPGTPGNPRPPGPPAGGIPIDGGLSLFLAAGAVAGAKLLYDARKKSEEENGDA